MIERAKRVDITPAQFALGGALVTTAWYALPDAVRSRPARAAIKAALLAATGVGVAAATPTEAAASGKEALEELQPTPGLIAGALALAAAGVALSVATEKAIYAFGERRRARGVRLAHTLPALALGAATGAVLAIDPDARPTVRRPTTPAAE